MKLKNKEKVEVFVPIETKEMLKQRAEKLGTGIAGIIKIALDEYLKK